MTVAPPRGGVRYRRLLRQAAIRAELDLTWCPSSRCGCDTIPLPNGTCGFCDRQLKGRRPRPEDVRVCPGCGGRFVVNTPKARKKRWCSEACKSRNDVVECVECGGRAARRADGKPPRCRDCAYPNRHSRREPSWKLAGTSSS